MDIDLSALRSMDYYNVLVRYLGVLIVTKNVDDHIVVSLRVTHKKYIKNEIHAQQVLALENFDISKSSHWL